MALDHLDERAQDRVERRAARDAVEDLRLAGEHRREVGARAPMPRVHVRHRARAREADRERDPASTDERRDHVG